ncbi:MAG: transcriptional repressor NrdR [Deltaproteobacteria bacterium]|nr:MAG: transcriptional repressor NrdR [Deltaproteobacteria bacterium]
MRCPECQHLESRVVDSRSTGDHIRRRRECASCGHRFTTYERAERPQIWVLKKGGVKEPFSHEKVLHGLALACRKRPVRAEQLDEAAAAVRVLLEQRRESPVPSSAVGEAVLEVLREIDAVAYVRFASVYQEFESVAEFVEVIRPLTERA